MTQTVNTNTEVKKIENPRKKAQRIEYGIKYTVFTLMLVIMLFPFFFMIMKSLMSITDINAPQTLLFPTQIVFDSYDIIIHGGYLQYIGNSLLVVLINAIFVPLTSCMVAFPLARYRFPGSNFMFTLILATSMIPSSVVQVPQYTLFVKFGLYDNLASQYIGAFFGGSGMQIFLIIQFMRALPHELDEAATIDGANLFMIFVMIIMPLSFNIFLYTSVGVAMAQWSNFQGPLIYLETDSLFTIAVAFFYRFGSQGDSKALGHVQMAFAFIMTIVPAILFFCFQKQMIGGVKLGAVKG